MNSPPSDTVTRKRRRSDRDASTTLGRHKTACQTCRNRKVKCDLQRPVCALCEAAGNDCVYLSDPPKQTLETVAETLTGRLDIVTKQLEDLKLAVQANGAVHARAPQLSPQASTTIASPPVQQQPATEPSRDFSHIPPHRTTADNVLTWPVFGHQYVANYLVQPLLSDPEVADPQTYGVHHPSRDNYSLLSSVSPLDEERIPALVDVFLQNVHTKNPVLDVDVLVLKGREAATHGLGWDAWSCCLLLTCALGFIAKPFTNDISSPRLATKLELQAAEQCFVLACRRLGLLKHTILACQCHFYAGVYLMYTLRPMLSWQHFHQAAITYQLYLKINGKLSDNLIILDQDHLHWQDDSHGFRKQARLEQRLYWSCFKSEHEFRVELPLPQSEIADYEFPKLFPSPPSPVSGTLGAHGDLHSLPANTADLPHALSERSMSFIRDSKSIRQTESWYYYLTEVALRRIGNRIINSFFTANAQSWLNIEPYLDIAVEFEAQVSSWYANLPPAMQQYEIDSTIRAPRSSAVAGLDADYVSQELSWATENRLSEMRSWLYQPFLYYLVHAKPPRPDKHAVPSPTHTASALPHSLSPESSAVLWALIMRGIECNLTILDTRSLPHRHHGLWYDLRAITCASLILLAVIKSGYGDLIGGGISVLVSDPVDAVELQRRRTHSSTSSNSQPVSLVGGKFGRVLAQLRLWSTEAPEMARHADVLEHLIHETIS